MTEQTGDDGRATFGGRPYDVPKCEHGCCPDAVCAFVGDCDAHGRAYTDEEIAAFYASHPTFGARPARTVAVAPSYYPSGVSVPSSGPEPSAGAA